MNIQIYMNSHVYVISCHTFYHNITSPQQTTQGKGKLSPKKKKAEEDSGEEDEHSPANDSGDDDYHTSDADEVSSIS